MARFFMEIAGQTAEIHSLFDSTPAYFHRYLSEKQPDFTISVRQENLLFEQEDALKEAQREGFRPRVFPDPFLERAAIQRQFAEHLFDRDVLLFHGSCVAVDTKGYLFTAKSGTGKSTHTRFWRELFGSRAHMVNDDKPFLALRPDGVYACGSPWSGKHGLDDNITVSLQGICILERGVRNCIQPIPPEDALPRLLHESFRPLSSCKAQQFTALVSRLAASVPLWHMTCTRDLEAAQVAFEAMSN